MKRLLCRWAEYHLALCEDDIEHGLPGWVRRHLQACPHCQAERQNYRRAREAVRRYAGLLPDSPPTGWRPLLVSREVKQRTFPLQLALAPAAAVVVVTLGFVLWQSVSAPVDEANTSPQMAQSVTPLRLENAPPSKKPFAPSATPSAKTDKPKRGQSEQSTPPVQNKPASSPRHAPPVYHPPRHIVIAAQPKQENTLSVDTRTVAEPSPEPDVPVQPVLVEAHPVTSAPVPEGYVIEAAHPATAGAVE